MFTVVLRLYDVLLLLIVVIQRSEAASLHSVGGILNAVVRKPGLPDTLFPTICPPLCSELFHAEEIVQNNSYSERCTCMCPRTMPVYLNTAGYCVDRLDECRHNLAFNSSIETERLIPVVSLPAKNGVLHPKVPIRWRDGGIAVSPEGSVDCTVSAVFFDNMDHRWRATTRRTLFEISTVRGRPAVMFLGTETDVAILTGAVVQLKLSCAGFAPDEHCLSFRVTGVSGENPYLPPSSGTRAELLFILVLAFLLALTVIGSFIVWHLCWRIKKRQLISDIQMQFLYHLQQQQEAQKMAAAHASEMSQCEFKAALERIPKRRLYFSSEYLDEAMMVNPPPVAEQFLADLRRVIETARERIRMRRFVPMLITIPEDHEETTSSVVQENEPNNEESHVINQQESPKSDKSVDSGRESRSDSDDSSKEEEDEDEEVQPQENENPQNEERKGSVRNLVHGFETRSSPTTQLPKPSRIPPRIPAKPRAPPTSQIPTLLGESSPRPLQKSLSLARVPSLPKTSPPRMPSDSRARKGYAVFPADPMLNKSLPRRKRAIPRLVAETSSSTSTASS
ncbi:hypothetical protein RB195_000257 [Necator americanus]|uniref:Shavenoid isoform B-like N-terminal domain-containing protein n=1 Tax=Necator americanus TaxID=51031 RepID=A0ABR1D8R6_NECAM